MASPDCIHIPLTPGYTARLAREFQQLRQDEELTDFTIHSGARSYSCHNVLLAAGSPVLKAMVRSSMVEGSSRRAEFPDIPQDVMEVLLDYMYTGQASIPHDLLLPTVQSSDFLQMLELKELCLSQAVKVFKPSQAISWSKLADQLEIEELKSRCSKLLATSLTEISKCSEFLELSIKEIHGLIREVQASKTDPDDVLEATLTWSQHNPSGVSHLENLVQNISLSACSIECLETQTETHRSLLNQCPEVLNTLLNIANFKLSGARRRRKESKCIVFGGQGKSPNRIVWDVGQGLEFVELCECPVELGIMTVGCGVPGGFVLTGGIGGVLCCKFDLETKSWTSLPPLRQSRFRHGAVFSKGRIFLFGGSACRTVSASVESLKLDEEHWTDRGLMSEREHWSDGMHKADEELRTVGEEMTPKEQNTDRDQNIPDTQREDEEQSTPEEQRTDGKQSTPEEQRTDGEQSTPEEQRTDGEQSTPEEQRTDREQSTTEEQWWYEREQWSTEEQSTDGKQSTPEEQRTGREQRTEGEPRIPEEQKTRAEQWTDEPDLPYAMWCPEVADIRDELFLLDVYTNTLWTLDTGTQSWIRISTAPVNCYGARMISVRSKLMVAGGEGNVCVLYDPDSDTWETLRRPSMKHEFGALVAKGRKVYLMGGLGEDRVEEYDLDTDEWSVCNVKVPKKLYNLHAVGLEHW